MDTSFRDMYISVQNSKISFLTLICIGGHDYVMELLKFVIYRTGHRFRTLQFPYRTPTIWFCRKTPVRLEPITTHPIVPIGSKCCTHDGKISKDSLSDGCENWRSWTVQNHGHFFVRCIFKYMHEFMLA